MLCIIIKTFNEINSIPTQALAANFVFTTFPTKPVFFLAATSDPFQNDLFLIEAQSLADNHF